MSKFKVGDRVKIIKGGTTHAKKNLGKEVILTQSSEESIMPSFRHLGNKNLDTQDGYCYLDDYELIEENRLDKVYSDLILPEITKQINNTNMNLITTFKNITRTEPNKTFVKAGVMNEDLSLTSEGKELFIQYIFEKNNLEFKKDVVDAILAEQEKK